MPITTVGTANDILNQVAAEIGLTPVVDPYSSQDEAFIQMRYLLNTAGNELVIAYPWELMNREASITTGPGDTGVYPLPDDFYYMIDQTGWERSQNVPLFGPLSPQDWQYLKGRDLVTSTIYASFRLKEGTFNLFPQPPPENLDIKYEYISKNWVSDGAATPTFKDEVTTGTDVPLYDKTLIGRYLKVKMLSAKGFDTDDAKEDFAQLFGFHTGLDKGAEILNAGSNFGYPYLNTWRNLPDSGYGL